jgi:hypothetical protein
MKVAVFAWAFGFADFAEAFPPRQSHNHAMRLEENSKLQPSGAICAHAISHFGTHGLENFRDQFWRAGDVDDLESLAPKNVALAQPALRWILEFPAVTCAIPGAKRRRKFWRTLPRKNILRIALGEQFIVHWRVLAQQKNDDDDQQDQTHRTATDQD